MFDDIGAGAASSSWGGMQSLPEISYGVVLPTMSVVKTPDDLLQLAYSVNTAIKQESTQHKPLANNRARLEKRAGGAITKAEAEYTLQRMASFAHSRAAPQVGRYVETVKVDGGYPNGGEAKYRNRDGTPKNYAHKPYFDYQVAYTEWTTGTRKDQSVGRVTKKDAGTVARGEGGVPIAVVKDEVTEDIQPSSGEGSQSLPAKITNHFYKKGQPIYKQPYVYYSIGVGIIGFFFWYRSRK